MVGQASALAGFLALFAGQSSQAVELTLDLGLCSMPAGDFANCVGAAISPTFEAVSPSEEVWIDFVQNGTPDAHIVSHQDAIWIIDITFEPFIGMEWIWKQADGEDIRVEARFGS